MKLFFCGGLNEIVFGTRLGSYKYFSFGAFQELD